MWTAQVDHLIKLLSSPKRRSECRKCAEELARLLPGQPTPQKLSQLDARSEECREFTHSHYKLILEAMISNAAEDEMVLSWMDAGPAEESLHVLTEAIKVSAPCKRRDVLVDLVDHLIQSDAFLFTTIAPSFRLISRWQWEEDWLHQITNLPDVLANTLQIHLPLYLAPSGYYRSMAVQLGRCLFILCEAVKHSVNVTVGPLALFVSGLCSKSNPSYLLEPLIDLVNNLTSGNFIARRLWSALVCHLNDRCLEQVVTYLSKWSPSTLVFKRLVGINTFPLDDRYQRLLCHKLLLLRGFTMTSIGRNILTLLACHPQTLLQVTNNLLSVWSDKNSLLLTSPEQHEFISKCIVMALHLLAPETLAPHRAELHRILRQGVSHHLESPQVTVRILGMFVAEVCTKRIHVDGPALEFSYDKSEPIVNELENLLSPEPDECQVEDFEVFLEKMQNNSNPVHKKTNKCPRTATAAAVNPPPQSDSSSKAIATRPEDLDSDDDLEPYDMSEDTVESKFEAPSYIRDLMDMLGNTHNEAEEYEKLRLSFDVCEDIIRQQLPRDHPSLARQLLSVLIHLQDKYSLPDFDRLRRSLL